MNVEILQITPDAEFLIEVAGRTCYQSDIGDPSIIRKWIKSGHESMLEHCCATFIVREVSRVLTHQLVRHRIGFSYSQQSQRYVSEEQFGYVIPQDIIDAGKSQEYMGFMASSQEFYNELVSRGVRRENARFVLPNACHTEIVVTLNFRAARNFFKLRLDKAAQWEIRDLAKEMLGVLKSHAPNVFYDMEVENV